MRTKRWIFAALLFGVLPRVSIAFDCSKAKTKSDCAYCCSYLAKSMGSDPFRIGCHEASTIEEENHRISFIKSLAGKFPISAISLQSICSKDEIPAEEGPVESQSPMLTVKEPKTFSLKECVNRCSHIQK